MTPTRRTILAGAGAFIAAPSILRAAPAARVFRVVRDGDDIGTQTTAVSRVGDEIQVAVDVELKVKILGITAYRYEMANREIWRGGRLVSMDSTSNDDGDAAFARVRQAGGELEVEGSYWSGTVPADSATTTYWTKEFLNRPLWISTADGDPLKVNCSPAGAGEIAGIPTETWAVRGDLELELHYRGDEWVSVRFDAGGEDAIYYPENMNAKMAAVWTG